MPVEALMSRRVKQNQQLTQRENYAEAVTATRSALWRSHVVQQQVLQQRGVLGGAGFVPINSCPASFAQSEGPIQSSHLSFLWFCPSIEQSGCGEAQRPQYWKSVACCRLPETAPTAALGRVRVYISTSCDTAGPRTACSDDQATSQVFGVDTPGVAGLEQVSDAAFEFTPGLKPGESVLITDETLGYPRWSLTDLPASDSYCFQAELLPYTKYTRGDGAVLTLPTSCVSDGGKNGAYASPDGTLYSKPTAVAFDPEASGSIDLELTEQVPKA
eukprot:6205411-Amphidinium_carterae.1